MRHALTLSALSVAALFATTPVPTHAQETPCFIQRGTLEEATQRQSPLTTTEITVGGQAGTFCYGAPSARGRTIMGDLVPFGRRWRLGANEASAIHLPFAAEVGGVSLEPGSYSLYAVPGESEWEIFINSSFERWGIPINEAVREHDLGSLTVAVAETQSMVEQLTVTWEAHGEDMGHLVVEWENTRVEIPVHAGS